MCSLTYASHGTHESGNIRVMMLHMKRNTEKSVDHAGLPTYDVIELEKELRTF